MVMTIRKGEKREKLDKILSAFMDNKRGIDAYKYCGVIKLKMNPMRIQKQLRGEWE